MTVAICFNCGKFKFGAWAECNHCGKTPKSDDDIVLSLVMTDHYYDEGSLEHLGGQIAKGMNIILDEDMKKDLLEEIHSPAMADVLRKLKE